jgi:hypothetical protein
VPWNPTDFAIIIYCAALGMLFRTFYDGAPSDVKCRDSSHSHPAVRACIACAYILSRAFQTEKGSYASLVDLTSASVRNIEEMWADLLLPGERPKPLREWAIEVRIESNNLLEECKQFDDVLNRNARVNRRWSLATPLTLFPKKP